MQHGVCSCVLCVCVCTCVCTCVHLCVHVCVYLISILSITGCMCVWWCLHHHRYQHSRHLVNALNKLADTDADLPDGWEKKLNQQGKASGCGPIKWAGGCGSLKLQVPGKMCFNWLTNAVDCRWINNTSCNFISSYRGRCSSLTTPIKLPRSLTLDYLVPMLL